ncbi:MAG: bifunctional 4-hydroxy-2-oxoglutarate aldolase/2-dehydro-3-deoxy-phosphogluconate aldolase [Rhodospirillales bacterium]|nr:bifunctional 4-hydroxy-2-oxoglutarate aldolase/2-dehydro-3-deoxy-phosphogluconate aldolase [Rhodospirillales bacterium]MDE0711083.1 bifunctional 4-hydroxy-2-oxoglutarate aldolase/2-dehydro-3-deoxy-phosphogluconate aldolase [Rhodospirillales bacterium]
MTDIARNVLARLGEAGVVPVVELEHCEVAVPLARALLAGGLPVAEITFRSEAAAASIRILREQIPEMLVGAGTVLNVEQVELAYRAGSQFVVTPGFNPAVVEACIELDVPILPGINNPTGVEQAMGFGLEAVKFFPAEASGGVSFLKALSGPYPSVRFLPTGGIALNNLRDYLALPNVLACGGTWIVSPALVRESRFDEITRLADEAIALAARNS